jgi:putative membrane protein
VSDQEEPWRTLHPASLAVNLLPRTWATVRSAWPLLLALFFGGRANGTGLVDLLLIAIFLVMSVGGTIAHWLTLRYRLVGGRLELKSGFLDRQVRVIAAERVQNVELVQNVFHRLSGLVEVRIETASGTEVEGLLSALQVDEARRLVDALQSARPAVADAGASDVLVANGPLEIAWYGATTTRFGVLAVMIGVGFEALSTQGAFDVEALDAVRSVLGAVGGVFTIIAIASGAWLLGIGTSMLRHYGFRLVRERGVLLAEQGLLTRRRTELSFQKVQCITVAEPVLSRTAGFASVWIETAAAREGGDGTQHGEAVVPYAEAEAVRKVAAATVTLGGIDPIDPPLQPPHPRALVRALVGATVRGLLLGGVLAWWFYPWGLLALLFVPLQLVTARLDFAAQGWLVTDDVVVSRRGWLSRRTVFVPRNKLQSALVEQGPFLRRARLGMLTVRVAGSQIPLPLLGMDDALGLQRRLVRTSP